MVNIQEILLFLLSDYGWLVALLGGIFAGEEVIITLAFLAANGYISIWTVFIFSFIGIFLCDLFFFIIGRMKFVENLKQFESISHFHSKLDNFIELITRKSTFRALLYTKFIFGTRIFTLILIGLRKTKFGEFILSDLIVVLIWMSVVVSLGWFAGNSFNLIIKIFNSIQIAILFLVAIIIIILLIKRWIEKELIKKQNRLN